MNLYNKPFLYDFFSLGGENFFYIIMGNGPVNPVDAITYYCSYPALTVTTSATVDMRFTLPACRIVSAHITVRYSSTPSSENIQYYVRKNNSSDTFIGNLSLTGQNSFLYNDALNIQLAALDFIHIKLITPTWVTNPTNLISSIILKALPL